MTSGPLTMQICSACGTVQYPRREICRHCLSAALRLSAVSGKGLVYALSELRHSLDPLFRRRLPWRIATVKLGCGPVIIAHAHHDIKLNDQVRVLSFPTGRDLEQLAALPVDFDYSNLSWDIMLTTWWKENRQL